MNIPARLNLHLLGLIALICLLAEQPASSQLVNVDFNQNNGAGWGGGGPNPGPTMSGPAVMGKVGDHWNGINVNSGTNLPLTDARGNFSTVTLSFTSGGGYDVQSFGGSTPFAGTSADGLMEDYLYTGGSAQTVTLAGLLPSAAYHLVLYSAANSGAGSAGRTTYFTVNGIAKNSVWDGASGKFIAGVDYSDYPSVLSDASGVLTITYSGNGTLEGDLNGFQLQPAPLTLQVTSASTNTVISFPSQTGLSYWLQSKTNLADSNWQTAATAWPGTDSILSLTNLAGGSPRYFRVAISTNPPAAPSFLHVSGTNLVNASGNVVHWRGVNLGGWFIMEKWMCPLDAGNLPDTYSAITNLDHRVGVTTEQAMVHAYQTNWITTADLDNIARAGFNCVRMPVWWGNFYSITNMTSSGWRSDAFVVLDWLVTNCAARGIYVVIDMHGVVGGQGTSGDTGWQNQNQYWTNALDQSQTAYMWRQIAAHFNGNPAIGGYDLINEPNGTTSVNDVWPAYADLYNTIRAVDTGHIIVMEGTFGSWNWNMLPNPAAYGWTNIVYSMHEYQYNGSVAQIEMGADNQVADFTNHLSWNVPDWVGEWNDMGAGASVYQYSINAYDGAGISWCLWSYKAAAGLVPNGWGWYDPVYWPPTPNLETDSIGTILNDWQQWRTTTSFGVNASVGL